MGVAVDVVGVGGGDDDDGGGWEGVKGGTWGLSFCRDDDIFRLVAVLKGVGVGMG